MLIVVIEFIVENEFTFGVVCDTSIVMLENGDWLVLDGTSSTSW